MTLFIKCGAVVLYKNVYTLGHMWLGFSDGCTISDGGAISKLTLAILILYKITQFTPDGHKLWVAIATHFKKVLPTTPKNARPRQQEDQVSLTVA